MDYFTVSVAATALLFACSAEASTITFFDAPGTGVGFVTDNPSGVTAFDCQGDTFYCIVQTSIPNDLAFVGCGTSGECLRTVGSLDGVNVAAVFTIQFGGADTGQPFARFGYFSDKLPGMYIENGYLRAFPPGTVGLGRCVDYIRGCTLVEDGSLQTAFVFNYYGQSANLSPPFPLLGSDTIRFQAFPASSPTPVPEPASLLLLGSGLAGVVAKTRHRPKQRAS